MSVLRSVSVQALGIFGAAAVIFVVFGLLNPNFLTVGNLRDVAVSACVNALIGIGLTFVIITGGIDLSVGSIASVVGMISANLMVGSGVGAAPALLVGLVLGFAFGAVNGVLITLVKLPPFIATLGTMSVYQGLAYVVTDGKPVYNVPQPFVLMLNSYLGGVPIVVVVVIVVALLAWLLLRRTVFGQNVIATGGSEETAWLSGVRVARVKILVYGLSGTMAALAGMVVVARISAAQSEAGAPYLLTAIAAAVIGGANLMGGEGRIAGTLVGALILGALTNGLVLLNVPSFYEQIVTGLVVVIAVAVDQGGKTGWFGLRRGRPQRAVPAPEPEAVGSGPDVSVAGQRILVTGGDGLIGSAVAALLAELGARVTVFDLGRGDAAVRALRAGAENHTAGSVTDAEGVAKVVAGHDAVVHLAGLAGLDQGPAEQIYTVNTLGTFLVMEAAAVAGCAKVVYASSINASGLPLNPHPVWPAQYPWDEDEPADIADAYSLSKQANEAAALALARRHGLALTGLRYPLVRDITEDGGTVFAAHIRRALRADPRRQACEGWTYLHVRDAAVATVAALTTDTPPSPGILVAAPRTYLRQDTDDALRRCAPDVPRKPVPGREVPVGLHRAEAQLGFTATTFLEDLDPELLADLDEVDA